VGFEKEACVPVQLKSFVLAGAASVVLFAPAAARAETVTVGASADTCIFAPIFENQSNALGIHLYAGKNSAGNVRRALVQFDLAGQVPPGSTVTGVTVNLFCNRSVLGDNLTFTLHRVFGAWGEGTSDAGDPGGIGAPASPGDATWLHRVFNTSPWTTPGGDFAPSASTSMVISASGPYAFPNTPTLVSDVQGWVDAPATNAGFILMGDETVNEGPAARRFSSREALIPAERPSITITYTPPAGGCDSIDFNGDGLFPDTADIDDFLSVFSGGPCSNDPLCGDTDFNNDGLFPDTLDIDSLLSVFSGGPCLL
jgi:hypothetical protein